MLRKKEKMKLQMQFQNEILQKAEKTFIETQIPKKEMQWKMFLDSKNLIIDYDNVLGQGSNATVYKAIQKNSNYFPILRQSNISNSNFVAAKIPTQFDSNQAEEFIREINSLIFLKSHDNIITFLGWTMFGEIPVLITELADTTLLTYVQGISKNENFLKPCLQFLWQISHALEYISEKGMIHRDIACRNILIKEKTIAKLGDFGLCCFADEKTGTFKDSFSQKFPIKWLSLEALNQCIFSEKSDVWAFGILCFEVFSFGSIPYSKMLNSEMIEFLQNGSRLEKPTNATEYIYELMLNCWRQNPNERPNFKEISKGIRIMLENETLKYGYLSLENVLD
uniref:receptor protein-tyrosine kinase n=1 Tax=Panagrolaimus davidi TaxID=227884 RepID=A0A914QKS4_9BILA